MKKKTTREELGNEEKKQDEIKHEDVKQDEMKTRNPFLWTSQNMFLLLSSLILSILFLKNVFPPFFMSFLFSFLFSAQLLFLVSSSCSFFLRAKKKERHGLMQRMSRGPDHWHLNVNGLHSLNNVTARGSDQEIFQPRNAIFDACEKVVLLGNNKRWFVFKISERTFICQKKESTSIETKVTHTPCCSSFTPGAGRFPGREETRCSNNIDAKTLESFQMPTPTPELSTARRNVVRSATAECMTALDMPSLHSSVLGIHHDGRHCQCAVVIQSLFLPFREKNSHCNPPARD